MEFNISAEEKLNKFLEFNPDFPVFKSALPVEEVAAITPPANPAPTYGMPSTPSKVSYNKSTQTTKKSTKDSTTTTPKEESVTSKIDKIMGESYKAMPNNPFVSGLHGDAYRGIQDVEVLKRKLAAVESDGMGGYKAQNPKSSAVGKYQFLWNSWKDSIGKVTGVKTKEEFKNNPEAQERFFDFYSRSTLEPQLKTIKKEFPDSGMTDMEIMAGLHFRGLGKSDGTTGLRQILKNKNLRGVQQESFNISLDKYLKRANKA